MDFLHPSQIIPPVGPEADPTNIYHQAGCRKSKLPLSSAWTFLRLSMTTEKSFGARDVSFSRFFTLVSTSEIRSRRSFTALSKDSISISGRSSVVGDNDARSLSLPDADSRASSSSTDDGNPEQALAHASGGKISVLGF